MIASKSLPALPSPESLRKQAKKLARDIAAGDAAAIARARAHLPNVDLTLTRRNAQLVIAREYGYAGWQDLTAEVSKRLGKGLEWAAAQARRIIHDNDVERLKHLLAEYPALLSWQGNDWDSNGGVVGIATGAYGDAGDPERERWFTHARAGHATTAVGLWKAFVMERVSRAAHDGDVTAFVSTLQRERWLLGETGVEFQIGLIGAATLNDRGEIISALLDLAPALLGRRVSPEFHPIALALTYAKTHLIPLLTRIWPPPDDLPHAAGMGDLARVKRWFDEFG